MATPGRTARLVAQAYPGALRFVVLLAAVVGIAALAVLLAGLPLVLAAVLVAALLVLPAIMVEPALGLYLAVLSVPVQELVALPAGLTVTQVVVVLAFGAWVVHVLAHPELKVRLRLLAPWLIFLAVQLLSIALTSYSLLEGVLQFARWVAAFLAFVLALGTISDAKRAWGLVGALLLAPAVGAAVGVLQFALPSVAPESFLILGGDFARASGTFGKPNSYAGYLNMAWPLALALAGYWGLRAAGQANQANQQTNKPTNQAEPRTQNPEPEASPASPSPPLSFSPSPVSPASAKQFSILNSQFSILFLLGWLLAASPQLLINLGDTGELLYNRQAKNVWLAVYADIDYSRWNEAGDDVRLVDLVLADPWRFWGNWGRNLRAFVATGGEDTSEFGRAIGLRLLGFPANLLSYCGVLLWLWRGGARERLLVLAGALYIVGVAVGFALPRFFLPIVPLLALAAVAPVGMLAKMLAQRWPRLGRVQWSAMLALGLLASLAAGPRIGAQYVLQRQDRDAAAISHAVLARSVPRSGVRFALGDDDMLDDISALAALGPEPATIMVYSDELPLPPELAGREPFAVAGHYRAYELR